MTSWVEEGELSPLAVIEKGTTPYDGNRLGSQGMGKLGNVVGEYSHFLVKLNGTF